MRSGEGYGTDEMVGGKGTSFFIFNGPADFATSGSGPGLFEFNGPWDAGQHIYDFNAAKDSIDVSTYGFPTLTPQETLIPGVNLINGSRPVSATATFVYNNDVLYFYADGTGSAWPVLVAALIGGPATLGAGNINVVEKSILAARRGAGAR